jgi:pyruvate formate lyase activating enzyme
MQIYVKDIFLVSSLKGRESYVLINFAGSDFKYPYFKNKEVFEFKKEFQKDIKEIKTKIREYVGIAGGIIFCGGEPCLQRQALQNLAKWCKGIGFKIVLKTNGGSPIILHSLIKSKLVDKVRIEFMSPLRLSLFERITRAGTFFKENKEVMNNFRKSLDIVKKNDNKIGVVFRTVVVPGLIYRKEDILDIAKNINNIDCIWVLEQFSNENVSGIFSKIDKPSIRFLKNLREICLKKYPNLRMQISAY